jgi:threonylcarbamoyladenosine tRNA methylthiotransferase MtaB
MTMARVALHTLGCKLNFAETSTLGGQFLDRGYDVVPFSEAADVYVLNTCSVTERADRECRQLIRRALRRSPEAVVVVTGCYAQLAPEEIASIEGVDFVLGTREKSHIFDHVQSIRKQTTPQLHVSDIGDADDFGVAMSGPAADRTRAFLKVQDGCDYHCTFCTIPLARGASRSQDVEQCVEQARTLVAQGYKEIVLTGVNVGDYGRKIGSSLFELLQGLVMVQDLRRVRISSIEPNLLTDEILAFVADHEQVCRHFHIPLQSGSDSVLRRMRRRYTAGMYGDLVRRVRERFPDAGIGVDVITGFPGETEAEFNETHLLLADLPVSYLHVFTYSERPNTPAAESGERIPPSVRAQRNEQLRILGQRKRNLFAEQHVGRTVEVLAESTVEEGMRFGFTDSFLRVGFDAAAAQENELLCVRVTNVQEDHCTGEPAGAGEKS